MNKEKLIEEMLVEELVAFLWNNTNMYDDDLIFDVAEALYNAGYRKQSEGEWIRKGQDSSKCSLCGKEHNGGMSIAYFCPNCGAKMKGGEE